MDSNKPTDGDKPLETSVKNRQHYDTNKKDTSKRNKIIWISIAIAAVVLVSGGVIAAAPHNSDDSDKSKKTTDSSSSTTTDTDKTTTEDTTTDEAEDTSSSDTSSTTSSTTSGLSVAANDTCGLTKQVTQGPYYITGTSQLASGNNLNYDNLTGEKIKVEGYVYSGATGTTPVAGAKVEVWQADNSGSYHPNSNGAASSYSESQLSLRGYVNTDSNGYYYYYTIYPGEYTGRTRHIHTNTTASGYKGVVTQLIIPSKSGDRMTASQDNIAQSLPECNQVTFTTVDSVPTTAYIYRLSAQ